VREGSSVIARGHVEHDRLLPRLVLPFKHILGEPLRCRRLFIAKLLSQLHACPSSCSLASASVHLLACFFFRHDTYHIGCAPLRLWKDPKRLALPIRPQAVGSSRGRCAAASMEDLHLDALGDLPSIGASSTSGAAKSEPPTTPASKGRRRSGLLGRFGSPAGLSESAGAPGSLVSCADTEKSQPEVGACAGCGRPPRSMLSYYEVNGETEWALPIFRGSWCRDCFTCWRTC